MKNSNILNEKVAGGRILSLKNRELMKEIKTKNDKKERERLREAGRVNYRRGGISDLAEAEPISDRGPRVLHGGFLAPSMELNSLRPLQVGHELRGVSGKADWLIRSHPVMVVREEDLEEFVDSVTGLIHARASVIISHPFVSEYVDNGISISSRNFNNDVKPSKTDPACMCFYGDTDAPAPPPITLGDGTVRAPGIYDERAADANLSMCRNPRKLDPTNFTIRGRIVIMPMPEIPFTDFRLYVRDMSGNVAILYAQHAGSRALFGPSSAVYGGSATLVENHSIDGFAYGHGIKNSSGGGGFLSDDDGGDNASVNRRVDRIGTDAGPAILDVYVRYPFNTIATPQGLATLDAWAVRIR